MADIKELQVDKILESNTEREENSKDKETTQSNDEEVQKDESENNGRELKDSLETQVDTVAADNETPITTEQNLDARHMMQDTVKGSEDQSVEEKGQESVKGHKEMLLIAKEEENSAVETAKPGDAFTRDENTTIHQPLASHFLFIYLIHIIFPICNIYRAYHGHSATILHFPYTTFHIPIRKSVSTLHD